jgi:hypothetical protein
MSTWQSSKILLCPRYAYTHIVRRSLGDWREFKYLIDFNQMLHNKWSLIKVTSEDSTSNSKIFWFEVYLGFEIEDDVT